MQCKSLENGFTGLVRRAWGSYTTRVLSYWGNNNDFSLTHFWRNGWKRREKIIVVTLASSFKHWHDLDISGIEEGSDIQEHADIDIV